MAIPTPPVAPNPLGTNFAAEALAFTLWMQAFGTALPDELARINDLGVGAFTASSATSLTIGTGSKSLTIETGKGFAVGQALMLASTAIPTSYMTGQVTSYNSGTGALVVNVTSVAGSGTFAAWTVSVTAAVTGSTSIGTIATVAKTAPTDGTWLACDGSVYLQASYAALYAELGLLANNPNSAGDWTQRVLPTSTNWYSVTYGNGVFVAVAYNSTIAATSPDGITWTQRVLPTSTAWYSVTYGNGVFVAVAYNSTIAATSPDGITWTQRTLPASTGWQSVTYGNGVFVAVAYNSTIAATSPDGITWTQRTLPANTGWQSVTYGNGVFVAVANGSTIAANTPNILTYNRSTQFAVPTPAGQVGVKQYIKAL